MKKFNTINGLLAYRTTAEETRKIGGKGICDECGQMPSHGYLVPVLNHWMCKKCFDDWAESAEHYPEDDAYEARNAEYYEKAIGLDTQNLIKLIDRNPKLSVVPMVDSRIVGDDTYASYWLGEFVESRVDKYIIGKDDEVLFKSEYDHYAKYETLEAVYGSTDCEDLSDSDVERVYSELPWKEAIIVLIGLSSD